jgi:phytoene dehydrogenase-like protein
LSGKDTAMPSTTRRDVLKAAALAPLALADPAIAMRAQPAPAVPASAGSSPSRAEPFDYVVAGAGHNSLICAAYLARAGDRVLVLEGRAMIGGGVKTAEILLPGFKQDLCSSSHHLIARNALLRDNELNLRNLGYETFDPEVVVHFPFLDGASLTVYLNDPERTAATIARVSKKDAETFRRLAAARARVAALAPADRVSSAEGLFFQRLDVLSGFDAARQIWESPAMQAASLSGGRWRGVPGSDPGTGGQAFSMMDHMAGRPMPKGGSGMLSVALGRCIEANNGVILTGRPVEQLIIENGKCTGVECADGSKYRARKAVVSTLHVKHLLQMAPRDLWGVALQASVDLWQPEHAMFVFHYAFSEPPKYRLADGGTVSSAEASIMQRPASIFALTSDQAHGELTLDDYPLQVVHASVYDQTRAPPGCCTLKIEGGIPYALKEGPQHWDAIKERVADTFLTQYLRHTTNLTKDKVLAQVILSPLDIERMNPAMWRGSVHHRDKRWGIFAPYRMPIPGLYQTGSCTEAGGSVTGLPGRNAAAVILRDDGKTLEQIVATGRAA